MTARNDELTNLESETRVPRSQEQSHERLGESSNEQTASYLPPDDASFIHCLELMKRVWPGDRATPNDSLTGTGDLAGHTEQELAKEIAWGRFDLRRRIGQGTYGIVFLAFDNLVGREVAVKIPQAHVLTNADGFKRFLREGETAAKLDHPGIVPVFDVGEMNGVAFIVSAYCPGPNLAEWLAEHKQPIAPNVAAALVAQISVALDYAHSRGVLHRDLKPSNILLDQKSHTKASGLSFSPRITDFGLAKVLGTSNTATCDGNLVGTFRYMSPEQASGRAGDVGVQSDVWALGTILYELLAGQPAFAADDVAVLAQIQEQEPRNLAAVGLSIPADLVNICHRCLQKDLTHRYRTAAELSADLERFGRGEPVSARPLRTAERLIRWTKKRPAMAAMAVTLISVSLAGLMGILWQWQRANAEAVAARQSAERAEVNLSQAHEALVDFALIVQEFSLYRRPDDPIPYDIWDRVDAYRQKSTHPELPPQLRRPMIASHHLVVAMNSALSGDHRGALADFEIATSFLQQIVREQPSNRAYRRALATALYSHRTSLLQLRESLLAEEKRLEARRAFGDLTSNATLDANSLVEFAEMATLLGHSFGLRNRVTESLDAHSEALTAAKEAIEIAPSSRQARYFAARVAGVLGATRSRLRDHKTALTDLAYAREIAGGLCDEAHDHELYCVLQADIEGSIAATQKSLGNLVRAELAFKKGIEYAEAGLSQFPDKMAWNCRLANHCRGFAAFKLGRRDYEVAKVNFERAKELWLAVKQANRLSEKEAVGLGIVHCELARIYHREDNPDQMKANAAQGLAVLDLARSRIPETRRAKSAREACDAILAGME